MTRSHVGERRVLGSRRKALHATQRPRRYPGGLSFSVARSALQRAAATAGVVSTRVTGRPASRQQMAMPLPIVPAPTMPTLRDGAFGRERRWHLAGGPVAEEGVAEALSTRAFEPDLETARSSRREPSRNRLGEGCLHRIDAGQRRRQRFAKRGALLGEIPSPRCLLRAAVRANR